MSNELFTPILLQTDFHQDQPTAVETYLAQLSLDTLKPQVQYINTELGNISIETVRSLIDDLSYSTPEGTLRVFVLLAAESITLPAQHALLKSLEEPPQRTLVILVSSQPQALLPTILSRCVVVKSGAEHRLESSFEVPELITNLIEKPDSVSYAQCIELVEMYKDRGDAVALVENLIEWVHQSEQSSATKVKWGSQLTKTFQVLKQNVNVQLALEECFFSLK